MSLPIALIQDINSSCPSLVNQSPSPFQAKDKAEQRKQAKAAAGSNEWFELKKNTSVYVTGLPEDITVQEMVETFSKCGIIKEDEQVRAVIGSCMRAPGSVAQ